MASVAGFITDILEQLYSFTGDYGLAIILLTAIIRLIIFPLTASQTRSMKQMQLLQPELQKLQKKYKNDPDRLNKETMELWRKHNVNPVMGCLPILVQLPILYAFFAALRDYQFKGDPSFLWVPDLAGPDPFYILPILTALTTFMMSRVTTPTTAEGSQRILLYAMPVFIGWISLSFASGLAIYWIATNLFSVGQHYVMEWSERRRVGGEAG